MSDLPIDPAKLRGLVNPQEFGVPDEIGWVEGWRAWGIPERLPRYGVAPKLYSVTHHVHGHKFFWTPRVRAQAECRRCGDSVPGETCTCGFYSAKTLAHLMRMRYHQYDAESSGMFHVIGQVANWGKVIEGGQGWRSQYSYPQTLYVPFEAYKLATPLAEAYGVKVALKNTLKPVRASG